MKSLYCVGASLIVQLVKNPPVMQETQFSSWVGKIPWRRDRLPTPVFWPGEFHGLYIHQVTKSRTRLSDFHSLTVLCQARTVLGDEDTAVPKRKPCPHRVTFWWGRWKPQQWCSWVISARRVERGRGIQNHGGWRAWRLLWKSDTWAEMGRSEGVRGPWGCPGESR